MLNAAQFWCHDGEYSLKWILSNIHWHEHMGGEEIHWLPRMHCYECTTYESTLSFSLAPHVYICVCLSVHVWTSYSRCAQFVSSEFDNIIAECVGIRMWLSIIKTVAVRQFVGSMNKYATPKCAYFFPLYYLNENICTNCLHVTVSGFRNNFDCPCAILITAKSG